MKALNRCTLISLIFAGAYASSAMAATATQTVAVSATVVGTCKFTTLGSTIAFGSLDPSAPVDKTLPATPQPQFWCTKGTAYSLSDNHGLNGGGTSYVMRGPALTDNLPYTFTYTTAATGTGAGPGSPVTMDISAKVLGTDYSAVSAGNYTDTVTLTITF